MEIAVALKLLSCGLPRRLTLADLGILVTKRNDQVTVITPLEGTPAARLGIRAARRREQPQETDGDDDQEVREVLEGIAPLHRKDVGAQRPGPGRPRHAGAAHDLRRHPQGHPGHHPELPVAGPRGRSSTRR